MFRLLKIFAKKILPNFCIKILKDYNRKNIIRRWEQEGKPIPPPHLIKQKIIEYYQKKYSLTTLIETGTYLGDMVEAQRNNFNKIISIELSDILYERAKERFQKYLHIELYHGDSSELLDNIIKNIKCKSLFWLDGHYSEGFLDVAIGKLNTPIIQELQSILTREEDHVILIDDARCFTGRMDYPSLQELKNYISTLNNSYVCNVKDDVIRLVKNK